MTTPLFHNFSSAPTHVAPFSHAVEFDGWVQLTGQMPTDPERDTKPLPEGIQEQTRQVMENLSIILNEMQLSMENVLSTRVFLTNFKRDYELMNNVYQSYFGNDRLPARTCVGVTDLALEALVEIDMVAKRF
ncbi:MAG TPA: RidA family protein [Rhodospirillales bacterium]|jgi:reactive intermediate/imine deaminase|nr:RidA family protein [Rhodospirillales bacterium]|tara:strand:+ start:278 stop:673 length:396 start_codon:yes stop_codon:yes gene_type:complete